MERFCTDSGLKKQQTPSKTGVKCRRVCSVVPDEFIWRRHDMETLGVRLIAMVTSSNRNIFCVTGPLWGESTVHRLIPLTKASDAELWCFLWSTYGWANTRDASDLRHHRAHYDVSLIAICGFPSKSASNEKRWFLLSWANCGINNWVTGISEDVPLKHVSALPCYIESAYIGSPFYL